MTLCNLISKGEVNKLQDNSLLIKDGKQTLLKEYLKLSKKQKLRTCSKEEFLKAIKRKYNIDVDITPKDNQKRFLFNVANLQIQSDYPKIKKFYEREYHGLSKQWPKIISKLKSSSY